MSEYIHLIGAEDVQRAGNTISQAASDMQRAASSFDSSIHDLKMFLMNEFLPELRDIMEAKDNE